MSGFIINLNSEMKDESCVAKLDSDWFSISYRRVCLGVLGWWGCEDSFGEDDVSFMLGGLRLVLTPESSPFFTLEFYINYI